jgi:pimeloyl-ACP methyl ester carboxylesterase
MKRVVWILIALLVVIAVALTLNTITTNNETEAAQITAEGAEILELSSGDVQVVETPAQADKPGAPIVLIHGYAASVHWWDAMIPLLSKDHRVIAIDLLGHGGSEKPSSGYGMEDQAGLLAEALNRLRVQGGVVVGHSMGGSVATALATQSSELVDRVVVINSGPNTEDFGPGLPFIAKLSYLPVIGQLLHRISPDSAVKSGYEEAFAPGYDMEGGFENPDQVVEDYESMTYTSFAESRDAVDEYTEESPLDERLTDAAVPVMVIFGAEDQIVYADEAIAAYEEIPGARTATIEEAGHSPHVETPEDTARLILEFAADAGDEVLAPAPESEAEAAGGGDQGEKSGRKNQKIKGKGRKARQKEETQDEAPNADKPEDGGGGGGNGPNAEKGQKPPPDDRPGGSDGG